MIDTDKDMWVVRAEGGRLVDEFLNNNVVAIGWNEIGNMAKLKNNDGVKEAIRREYPGYKTGRINVTAGQLSRFAFEFNKGDYAVTYDSEERKYYLGVIESDYKYDETVMEEMNHFRDVEWFGEVLRDNLTTSAKNTLGSSLTIFQINDDVKNEMDRLLEGEELTHESEEMEEEELDIIKKDIIQKAHEFIKDKINELNWEELEELVAGFLRAMGYKTRITPTGPDRGRDVIASPDGLGFEEPRIFCEVKHRSSSMGSNEIRSFTGGLRGGDKGLYVSTGGFTKEAKYEAERAIIPVTLIDLDALVELVIQYYDNFDVETKTLIPLKKIYWPA